MIIYEPQLQALYIELHIRSSAIWERNRHKTCFCRRRCRCCPR